ncbi:hypothetical protein [Bradyrhizobium ottawaense]
MRSQSQRENSREKNKSVVWLEIPDAASMWRLSAMLQAFAGAAFAETGGRGLPVSEISQRLFGLRDEAYAG